MSAKGMICGGNTVIMCGACDMGRKSFFFRTHFFSHPPPPLPRGGWGRKKVSYPVSEIFFFPPSHPPPHPPVLEPPTDFQALISRGQGQVQRRGSNDLIPPI